MKLTYNKLMAIIDALDEFVYSRKSTWSGTLSEILEDIVTKRLTSSRDVAKLFWETYQGNPNRALVILVCDHYHPSHLDDVAIPGHTLESMVDFICIRMEENSKMRIRYAMNRGHLPQFLKEQFAEMC